MNEPHPTEASWTRNRLLVRKKTALLAVGISVTIWAVAAHVLDVEVRAPQMGDTPPADISALQVVVASLAASLAAWALLAALERFTSRARRTWTTTATVVLILSLGAPLTGEGIGVANQAVLVLLHLAVAGVVIPGMLHPTRPERTHPRATDGTWDEEVVT